MQKVLYRLYRPSNFDEVLGQEHIIKTLKNQIENNSIAHAYLFSGTRGTGKTSTAKIFAKSVNCLNPQNGNPCDECEICKGIIDENLIDIIEIDAASNNSVDDIREIKESVKYPPARARYKVYIIDEVHMLSQGAFNALLKTLEEPPEYVIFILATTEYHKMPATILSRCQKFDFKRINNVDIINKLRDICEDLQIEAQEEALNLISINSYGALRDALSILDQCISYCDTEVTYDDVVTLLGSINIEYLFDISEHLINKSTNKVLQGLNDVLILGKDIRIFIKDIINHFRNIMVCKVSESPNDIIFLPTEIIEKLKYQASNIEIKSIINIINYLSECESKLKYSMNSRVLVEIYLIKCCDIVDLDCDKSIIDRIEKLENMVKNNNSVTTLEDKSKLVKDNKNKVAPKRVYEGEIKKIWPEILEQIKKDKNIPMQAMLKQAEKFIEENNLLTIVFEDGYHILTQRLSQQKNKTYICDVIEKISGKNFILEFKLLSEIGDVIVEEKDKGISILENIFPSDLIEIKDE